MCGGAAGPTHCDRCGARSDDPTVQRIISLDGEVAALLAERQQLVSLFAGPVRPDLPPPPTAATTAAASRPPPASPVAAASAGAVAAARREGPHVATILLGLGVVLLVVAAIVFSAVNWDRLGPGGQAALLVAFTVAAGAATWLAARRALSSTAEALGVVTVAMGPILAQAARTAVDLPSVGEVRWTNIGVWSWWPLALVAVGAASLAFGRWVGIRSARWLGAVAVLLGVGSWALVAPMHPLGRSLYLVAGAALLDRARRRWAPVGAVTGRVWQVGAAVLLAASILWVVVGAVTADTAAERAAASSALIAFAVGAVAIGRRIEAGGSSSDAEIAGGISVAFASAAVLRGVAEVLPPATVGPVVAAAAVALGSAARAVGVRRPGDRAVCRGARVVAMGVVGLASVGLLAGVAAVLEVAEQVRAQLWELTATTRLAHELGDELWAWGVPGLAVAAAALASERRALGDRFGPLVGAVGLGAALGVPTVAVLPLWSLLGWSLAALAAMAAAAVLAPRHRAPAALGLALAAWVTASWAAGSVGLSTTAALAVTVVAASAAIAASRRGDGVIGAAGAVAAVTAALGAVALVVSYLDSEGSWVLGLPTLGAAVFAAALVVLVPDRRAPRVPLEPGPAPTIPAPTVAWIGAGAAAIAWHIALVVPWYLAELAFEGDALALTVVLAGSAAAFGVGAAAGHGRAARASFGVLALAGAVALVWLRLDVAQVEWPEAYLLPLAVAAGAVAVLAARWTEVPLSDVPSWRLEGPAVAVALVPTALISVSDLGLLRQNLSLVAAIVLLGVGGVLRRRAPVDIGAAVALVVGAQVLLPIAEATPRWVALGVAGILLVSLGATFEQRRKDVRELRRRYRDLR